MKMLGKKKIAVLAVVLMATLAVGAYAGMQLSNTLTASWNVINTQSELTLSWNPSTPGGNFATGQWYGTDGSYGIELHNTGVGTYNVIVKFNIDCNGAIPQNSIILQYYDGSWKPLPITTGSWGSSEVGGTFGPPSGFSVVPGYDVTTPLRIMFEGNATITNYSTSIWVELM
jgi:hypothetical protein